MIVASKIFFFYTKRLTKHQLELYKKAVLINYPNITKEQKLIAYRAS